MMAAEDLKALAKILRGLRVVRGLRVDRGLEDGRAAWIVAKVAAKTGLSAGSISGYELGYYGPSRASLEKLLDAYRAPEDLRARALQLHGCGAEGATPAKAKAEAERVAEFRQNPSLFLFSTMATGACPPQNQAGALFRERERHY